MPLFLPTPGLDTDLEALVRLEVGARLDMQCRLSLQITCSWPAADFCPANVPPDNARLGVAIVCCATHSLTLQEQRAARAQGTPQPAADQAPPLSTVADDDQEVMLDWKGDVMRVNKGDKMPRFL